MTTIIEDCRSLYILLCYNNYSRINHILRPAEVFFLLTPALLQQQKRSPIENSLTRCQQLL